MKISRGILAGILLPLLAVVFISCDKTEGQGSSSLEPGSDEAEIIEGFICSGIFENKPTGIDNDFFPDDIVYLWLSWGNVPGNHNVQIIWLDPSDNVVSDITESFNSKTGKAITHFFIDTTNSSPAGRWIAEVHIDDQFVRSYAFWLIEG